MDFTLLIVLHRTSQRERVMVLGDGKHHTEPKNDISDISPKRLEEMQVTDWLTDTSYECCLTRPTTSCSPVTIF
jgi:hypothetical protein